MAIASFTCFAVAAPGIERLVARELASLGEQPQVEDGGVTWDGDAGSLMRANLWLRTASRVLVRVARFRATAFYDLEKQAKRIDWGAFLAPGDTAEFRVTARKSKLYHSDAIAERLLSAVGASRIGASTRSHEPKAERRTQLFVVRVDRDDFTISADTSGELLHVRGYREAVAKAPIRETLAAALLLAAEWNGTAPLLDPFCGSGTIPIEAALIARGIAPGARRRFAFQGWPTFDGSLWQRQLDHAAEVARPRAHVRIVGSDRDRGAIAAATANAARAGVAGDAELAARVLSDVVAIDGPGLIATNPPYGKRVGSPDVRNLYATFGSVVRDRFPGWRVAMYAPEKTLARQVGLSFAELFRTSNGGIPVTALTANAAR